MPTLFYYCVKMAKAPKPWKLTESESFSSYTSWQSNILYVLSREKNFEPFLAKDAQWLKSSAANPKRGLVDDGGENGVTAAQKVILLEQMLGLIAQYVPHYLTNDIVKATTCLDDVWQAVRKYYGFKQSEVQKLSSIVWEDNECPERLYQRLIAHLQDNLFCKDSPLHNDGVKVTVSEEISPTVEHPSVLCWMELIHPGLPALVQHTFAYDLQRMSLKDLQPQICDALDGFLEELRNEATVSRAQVRSYNKAFLGSNKKPYAHRSPQSASSSHVPRQTSFSKKNAEFANQKVKVI